MPLDDGIWRYTEGESASPTFSELLNRLGDSVRSRFRQDDYPWTDVAPAAGFVGVAPNPTILQACRRNGQVFWRGRVYGTFPAGTQVTITNDVPVWARPSSYLHTSSRIAGAVAGAYAAVSTSTIFVRTDVAETNIFVKGLSGYLVG